MQDVATRDDVFYCRERFNPATGRRTPCDGGEAGAACLGDLREAIRELQVGEGDGVEETGMDG